MKKTQNGIKVMMKVGENNYSVGVFGPIKAEHLHMVTDENILVNAQKAHKRPDIEILKWERVSYEKGKRDLFKGSSMDTSKPGSYVTEPVDIDSPASL